MSRGKRKFDELCNDTISVNDIPRKRRKTNDYVSSFAAVRIKKTFARNRNRGINTKHLQKSNIQPISDSNSALECNNIKLTKVKKVQSTLDFPIKKPASKHNNKWNKCGPSNCSDCGMLYYSGRAEDDVLHSKFHNAFINKFNNGYKPLFMHTFIVWNLQNIAKNAPYFIENEQKKQNRNYKQMQFKINSQSLEEMKLKPDTHRKDLTLCIKYNEFIELKSKNPDILSAVDMMDRDLGYFTTKESKKYNNKSKNEDIVYSLDEKQSLYCFVERTGHKIVGCIVCEPREFAYKIKIKNNDGNTEIDNVERHDLKHKCYIGIVKIWVHHGFRRNNIASLLMDCVRMHFIYGTEIHKKHVAFCQPTRMGQIFAQKYCETRHILVY